MTTGNARAVRAVAAAGALTLAVAAAGCGGSGGTAGGAVTRPPAATTLAPPPSPTLEPAAPGDLKGALLTAGDLPSGFVARPLTARNLPSGLAGCAPLERLLTGAIGRHAQAEFFRPPLGPWIDEAVIAPRGGGAARVLDRLATAIGGCRSVTVTEEGHRVTLTLAPATAPRAGQGARAYRATGTLGGIGLLMDIVLTRSGGTVVLLTNAALAAAMDPALTASATAAAVARSARA